MFVDHCLVGDSADTKSGCGFHYNAVLVILVIGFKVVLLLGILWDAMRIRRCAY